MLLLGNTLAASFIWGINTIFLLDAGLSNLEAFAANAFFTAGMVLFEVPTGVVADTVGRRASYLLGTVTLTVTTLLYVLLWEIAGTVLGVGASCRCCSASGSRSSPARWRPGWSTPSAPPGSRAASSPSSGGGRCVSGVAMLDGSVAGGFVAQLTQLGVPFLLRGAVLVVMFALAFAVMRDVGFTPRRSERLTTRDARGSPARRSSTAGGCRP